MYIKTLVLTAAIAAVMSTVAAGTAVAATDPPYYCLGPATCDPNKVGAPVKDVPKDDPVTAKGVCKAWEDQANVNFNQQFDNCKYIPGK